MRPEFDPQETIHIDIEVDEFLPESRLTSDKFVLWFQPVYELSTGRVLHNEVLVRWLDNNGKLRSPQELFDVLQGKNLLLQLDRIVVQKSLKILAEQSNLNLSINLFEEVLQDSTFLSQLQKWLEQYEVSPKRLSFELEEESIRQNFEQSLKLMQELKQLGCGVVMDSCSGSYFSLQQWQALPIDMIKLDRSLLRKTPSPEQRQLALLISQVSIVLKKRCIAKGIDDKRLLAFAHDIGVQGVQGYLLSVPKEEPKTFIAVSLILTKIIGFLILLYIIKTLLGINLSPDKHAWEVISDFMKTLVRSK